MSVRIYQIYNRRTDSFEIWYWGIVRKLVESLHFSFRLDSFEPHSAGDRSAFLYTIHSFATRVSQLKIWHFWVTIIKRNVRKCTFNRYSVITPFVKLAAGEQLCRRCTHRKLKHFKTKSFSQKITNFELRHCCRKWATCIHIAVLRMRLYMSVVHMSTYYIPKVECGRL